MNLLRAPVPVPLDALPPLTAAPWTTDAQSPSAAVRLWEHDQRRRAALVTCNGGGRSTWRCRVFILDALVFDGGLGSKHAAMLRADIELRRHGVELRHL